MTRPTPREMRALEDAAATELAAGCREVERGDRTMHLYGDRFLETEPAPGLPDYLVRIMPSWGDINSCDYGGCFAPEYEDILEGTSDELRPIYLDTRHEVRICQRCVEAGKHLTDDGGPRPCP